MDDWIDLAFIRSQTPVWMVEGPVLNRTRASCEEQTETLHYITDSCQVQQTLKVTQTYLTTSLNSNHCPILIEMLPVSISNSRR